jgi:hypothetical protein
MSASRRDVVVGAGLLAAGAAPAHAAAAPEPDAAWFQAALERFAGFGVKASGGPGDQASGAWLQDELQRAGYRCARQAFETPYAAVRTATLAAGGHRATVFPQAIVTPTGPQASPGRCASLQAAAAWRARSP